MRIFRDILKQIMRSSGVVFMAVLMFCSCTSEPEPRNEIEGSWIERGGTETMEFFEDSTVTILDEGETLTGRYQVIADTLIRLKVSGVGALAAPIEAEGYFSNGEMTFVSPRGDTTDYKKFK